MYDHRCESKQERNIVDETEPSPVDYAFNFLSAHHLCAKSLLPQF